MRQIERYVMVELLRVFGVLITISTLLFVFVGAFAEAQKMDLGVGQVLQILPYLIPSLMPYTIPATLLLSVCVVYGRMAGDNEIIAVRAAGIHVMHLMWPAFFIAGSLSVIALILTDQITPWAFRKMEQIIVMAIEDIFLDKLRSENTYSNKEKGITISVTGVKGRNLIEPTIRFAPPGQKATTISAKSALIDFDLRKRQVKLTLFEMYGNFSGKDQKLYSKRELFAYALPTEAADGGNRVLRTQELLSKLDVQLMSQIDNRRREAIDAAFALARGDFERLATSPFTDYKHRVGVAVNQICTLRTEYYNRFSMSLSGFFVVLVGTPFSILMAKKQFLTSFLFCFLPILTVYYPVAMMTQNLSKSGQIDPAWSAWVANAVLLVAAAYNTHKVLRN